MQSLIRRLPVENDKVPVLFSIFSVFVDIEDLRSLFIISPYVLAKAFFEFLNI